MLRWVLSKFSRVERFNQIVWAIIGAGIIAMVAVLLIAGLVVVISSMINSGRGGMPVAMVQENAPDEPGNKPSHYDICMPLAVRGSPYQLIRVVSDQFLVRKTNARGKFKKMASDSYSEEPVYGACSIYGSSKQTGVVNVIVRHAVDNSMHLLLKENAVIKALDYPHPTDKNEYDESPDNFPPVGTLYWEIAFEDSNSDAVFDDEDDFGAYLSSPDGSRLVRITPEHSRVLEKSYDKERKLLLLRILRDTNNDKVLDEADKPSLIEVNVVERKMTREVLDAQTLAGMMRHAEPKQLIKE